MVTVQTYECPVHGKFELAVPVVYDLARCWERFSDDAAQLAWDCEIMCEWRPSAPAVHGPEDKARHLASHVRDTNPW